LKARFPLIFQAELASFLLSSSLFHDSFVRLQGKPILNTAALELPRDSEELDYVLIENSFFLKAHTLEAARAL
jgi:hypothetical protein